MEKENIKYQNIERYLAGDLAGDELARFEKQMDTDSAFVEEIKVNRDLERFLGPDQEDKLESDLRVIGEQFADGSGSSLVSWIIRIGIALLLIGFAIWYWKPEPKAMSPTPPPVEITTPPTEPMPQQEESITPTENQEQQSEPSSPPSLPKPQEPKSKPSNTSRPIAVNFTPNPLLEAERGNFSRSAGFQLSLTSPELDQTFQLTDGQIAFEAKGLVKTGESTFDEPLQLLLFTNKPEDYQAYEAIKTQPLVLETTDAGFSFAHSEPLTLSAGLYYLLIENSNTGELHLIERFRVE